MFSPFKDKLQPDSEIGRKITDSIGNAVEEHRPQIKAFMERIPMDQLQSDENIEKVARFVYPLLPGVVRMIVKEDAFAAFVLEHRSIVTDKILPMVNKPA